MTTIRLPLTFNSLAGNTVVSKDSWIELDPAQILGDLPRNVAGLTETCAALLRRMRDMEAQRSDPASSDGQPQQDAKPDALRCGMARAEGHAKPDADEAAACHVCGYRPGSSCCSAMHADPKCATPMGHQIAALRRELEGEQRGAAEHVAERDKALARVAELERDQEIEAEDRSCGLAKPDADEAAHILAGIISTYGVNAAAHPASCLPHAGGVLAAIRAGKVPGIWCHTYAEPVTDEPAGEAYWRERCREHQAQHVAKDGQIAALRREQEGNKEAYLRVISEATEYCTKHNLGSVGQRYTALVIEDAERLRRELEQWMERFAAAERQRDQIDGMREAQADGARAVRAERDKALTELAAVKAELQGDLAQERGSQSALDAARETNAVLRRHVDGEAKALAELATSREAYRLTMKQAEMHSRERLAEALVNAWPRLRKVAEAAKEVDNRSYGEWADQPSEDSLDALRDAIKALEDA